MMNFRRLFLMLAAVVLTACQTQQGQPDTPMVGEQIVTENRSGVVVRRKGKVRGLARRSSSRAASVVERARTPRAYVPRKPGRRVSHVNVPGKYVALTFDDGPSAAYTPQVLDILKRHGARATFFVVGRSAAANKGILARAVSEGHEIANHTYSHIKMTAKSRQAVANEIERTNAIIKSATGYSPTVMRPPYGAVNSGLVDMMYNRYGFYTVLWDVDTRDWQKPGVSKVVSRAVGQAQPGSIILLHDIHASTLAAVEQVVTGLQARGYKLVTVSQLIAMGRRASGDVSPASPEGAVTAPATGGADIQPVAATASESL